MCLCLHQPISGVAGYATKEIYDHKNNAREIPGYHPFCLFWYRFKKIKVLYVIKKLENSIQPFFVIYLNTVCKCLKQKKEKKKEKRGGISI